MIHAKKVNRLGSGSNKIRTVSFDHVLIRRGIIATIIMERGALTHPTAGGLPPGGLRWLNARLFLQLGHGVRQLFHVFVRRFVKLGFFGLVAQFDFLAFVHKHKRRVVHHAQFHAANEAGFNRIGFHRRVGGIAGTTNQRKSADGGHEHEQAFNTFHIKHWLFQK
jgi:hypothetical protein